MGTRAGKVRALSRVAALVLRVTPVRHSTSDCWFDQLDVAAALRRLILSVGERCVCALPLLCTILPATAANENPYTEAVFAMRVFIEIRLSYANNS